MLIEVQKEFPILNEVKYLIVSEKTGNLSENIFLS